MASAEQSDLLKLNSKIVQYLARHEARDKLCRYASLFPFLSLAHFLSLARSRSTALSLDRALDRYLSLEFDRA